MRMEGNSPAWEKEWKTKGGKKSRLWKKDQKSQPENPNDAQTTAITHIEKFDKSEPLPLKRDTVGDTRSCNKDSLQQDMTRKQASGIQKTSEAKSQTYDSEAIWQDPTRIHRKNCQSKEHFRNYFSKCSQQKTHTETKMEKKSGSSKKTHRQSFLKVLTTEETLILHKGLSFIPTTSTPNRSQLLQDYKQYICPPPPEISKLKCP